MEGEGGIAVSRSHRHQTVQVEYACHMVDQRPGRLRRDARLLWLAWDVDLDENLLLRVRPGQGLGQVTRVDRVDELELPGNLLDLVGLEMADQMPGRAAHGGHLGQGLLDAV